MNHSRLILLSLVHIFPGLRLYAHVGWWVKTPEILNGVWSENLKVPVELWGRNLYLLVVDVPKSGGAAPPVLPSISTSELLDLSSTCPSKSTKEIKILSRYSRTIHYGRFLGFLVWKLYGCKIYYYISLHQIQDLLRWKEKLLASSKV